MECSIGASVSISAVYSLPLERLAPGLVSSSVRVEQSSFLSDGNANLFMLYASQSLASGLWQRVIGPIISRNQSTNEFFLRKSNVSA